MVERMHRLISDYFPNSKDYAVYILLDNGELEKVVEKAKSTKPKYKIKFRTLGILTLLVKNNIDSGSFYTAFLEYLAEKYSEEDIKERIKKWKEESILRYV